MVKGGRIDLCMYLCVSDIPIRIECIQQYRSPRYQPSRMGGVGLLLHWRNLENNKQNIEGKVKLMKKSWEDGRMGGW